MDTFTKLSAVAASLPDANVDTDIIFPARFLVNTEKTGLEKFAFYEKRFDENGAKRHDFVLNREPFRLAQILVAGDNFGCGSSRENAVWALNNLGIRCILATSFGEIFYSNCFKNGMLPILVTPEEIALLHASADTGKPMTIDLAERQVVFDDTKRIGFDVPDWRRNALLNGWDEVDMIINQEGARIAVFEAKQKQLMPWLYPL